MTPRLRRHLRAPAIAALAITLLGVAWGTALSRLPAQRASIERLLRQQTGLDVRYGQLRVRLGFYGPEAQLLDVRIARVGERRTMLRAPQLVARFDSWRLLRGGQLRPGRIVVSDAEVDLPGWPERARPPPPPGMPGASAPAAQSWDALASEALRSLLAGLPDGSIEFEGATLRLGAGAGEPVLLRAPRLYAARRASGTQLSGTLLLPRALGRTVFFSLSLEPVRDGAPLRGTLRASGRELALMGLRDRFAPHWPALAGLGDLRVQARLGDARVQQAQLRADLHDVVIARADGGGSERIARASGALAITPRDGGLEYVLSGIELRGAGDAPPGWFARPTGVEARVDAAGRLVSLRSTRLPWPVLRAVLALRQDAAPSGLSLAWWRGGELQDVELRRATLVAGGADAGLEWRARLVDGRLEERTDGLVVDGLDASVSGTAARAQIELPPQELLVAGPPWGTQPARLLASGRLVGRDLGHAWTLSTEALRLDLGEGVELDADLAVGAAAGTAARYALSLTAEGPLSRAQWDRAGLAPPDVLPAAAWVRAGDTRATQLLVQLAGALDEGGMRLAPEHASGRVVLRGIDAGSLVPLPAPAAVDAEVSWLDDTWQAQLLGGSFGSLRVRGGSAEGRRDGGGRFDVELAGRIEDLTALDGREAAALRVPGVAEGAVTVRLDSQWQAVAGRRTPWRAVARVAGVAWRPDPSWPAATDLAGSIEITDAGLRRARLDGRWLDGPVRLSGGLDRQELRLTASGRAAAAAIEAAWGGALAATGDGRLAWQAELRGPPPGGEWRLTASLAPLARADLRWVGDAVAGLRLQGGVLKLGDGPAVRPITGALIVGGRVEQFDLAALGRFLARSEQSAGWGKPLLGEVAVGEMSIGRTRLGAARLRLAGSVDGTSVRVDGPRLRGELSAQAAEPRRVFARLEALTIAPGADLARLPADLPHGPLDLVLDVDALTIAGGALGRLSAELRLADDGVGLERASLVRDGHEVVVSGGCARAAARCSVELDLRPGAGALPWADVLGLGAVAGVEQVAGRASVTWSSGDERPGDVARGRLSLSAGGVQFDAAAAAAATGSGWLGPTLAVLRLARPAGAAFAAAGPPRLDAFDADLEVSEGQARIARWHFVSAGRTFDLSGDLDLVTGRVEQRVRIRPAGVDAPLRTASLPGAAFDGALLAARRLFGAGRDEPATAVTLDYALDGDARAPRIEPLAPAPP